jgi:hypothetical protein
VRSSFYNTSFVFEIMDDFGGTNGMFGDLDLARTALARASAGASNEGTARSLAGSGISMEGIDQVM